MGVPETRFLEGGLKAAKAFLLKRYSDALNRMGFERLFLTRGLETCCKKYTQTYAEETEELAQNAADFESDRRVSR